MELARLLVELSVGSLTFVARVDTLSNVGVHILPEIVATYLLQGFVTSKVTTTYDHKLRT